MTASQCHQQAPCHSFRGSCVQPLTLAIAPLGQVRSQELLITTTVLCEFVCMCSRACMCSAAYHLYASIKILFKESDDAANSIT